MVSILLVIAGVTVDLLAANKRQNLALAKQEIVQRKQAEEEIKNSERRFHALHNSEHPDLPVQLSLGMATAEKSALVATFMLVDQRMYTEKAAHQAKADHTSVS